MTTRTPSYYPLFHCIAASCRHSCCIGWEIDIDSETAARYQSMTGSLGEELRREICWENSPHFRLQSDNRCPFLDSQGLCRLILEKGESILCEICTQHPRFHNQYGNLRESGLGLCCEEAGRLLFSQKTPVSFLQTETKEKSPEETPDWLPELLAVRETAFSLLQNPAYSLKERLSLLLSFGADVQDAMDEQISLLEASKSYEEDSFQRKILAEFSREAFDGEPLIPLLEFFRKQEPLDNEWPVRLEKIQAQIELLRPLQMLPEDIDAYEKLTVYFLFRYLLSSGEDGDILSKIKFLLAAVTVISLLDAQTRLETGSLSLSDRVENARIFSSEVEYSPDTLKLFVDACWEEDFLSFSAFEKMCSPGTF